MTPWSHLRLGYISGLTEHENVDVWMRSRMSETGGDFVFAKRVVFKFGFCKLLIHGKSSPPGNCAGREPFK